MKLNKCNLNWPAIIINITYWAGVICVGISAVKPLLIIGIGSLIYSLIYAMYKIT